MPENETQLAQQRPLPPLLVSIEKRSEAIQQACSSSVQYINLYTSLQKAIADSPKILNCSAASVMDCMMACAKLGIDPSGEHNSAWFIPYKDTLKLMIGYNGYIDLITRSSQWTSVSAEVVYKDEHFEAHAGSRNELVHTIDISKRDNPVMIVAAYAIANGPNGAHQWSVLDRMGINRAYQASKRKNLWDGFARPEMIKKSAVRALSKYMVLDALGKYAVAVTDEAHETGFSSVRPSGDVDDLRKGLKAFVGTVDPDTGEEVPPPSNDGDQFLESMEDKS